MNRKAVLGKMDLCYVKTKNMHIASIAENSCAKIVCINDAIVSTKDGSTEDDALR